MGCWVQFVSESTARWAYGVCMTLRASYRVSTLRAAATLALSVVCLAPAPASALGFTDIDDLGGNYSYANAVSGNGLVIVGVASDSGSNIGGFRYDSTMHALGDLGGGYTEARGVSYNGGIIVGLSMNGSSANRPFRFNVSTGIMSDMGGSLTSGFFNAISGDGHVAVGQGSNGSGAFAIQQVDAAAPVSLGFLTGGTLSQATGVSNNGSVIVGYSDTASATLAFKYTGGSMISLGTLTGGTSSHAWGVSADGATIVGESSTSTTSHAFKFVGGVMSDLGVLAVGGASRANATSSTGSIIVGWADVQVGSNLEQHAMKYDAVNGMVTLGTLGGTTSYANGVSADGSVIVGSSTIAGDAAQHAFIYTSGVMLDWDNWMSSLNGPNSVLAMASQLASLPMEGAHHRPLMSFDHMGKASQVWATGDFGASSRNTDSHVATGEIGASTTYGDMVVGLAAGHGSQNQDLALGGSAHVTGNYVLAEADYRLADKQSIISVVLMSGNWTATTARAYTTGAGTSVSNGTTGVSTESLRLRYDGPVQPIAGQLTATPFISTTWTRTKADAYAESGGSFAATFDAQSHTSSEGRLGLTARYALTADTTLLVTGEWIHRFDRTSGPLSGVDTATGLLPFSVAGLAPTANQARLGLDVDHKLNANTLLNFSAHVAGFGETPDVSVALSIRRAF